jgi:hypothetical protein
MKSLRLFLKLPIQMVQTLHLPSIRAAWGGLIGVSNKDLNDEEPAS